MTFDDNRQFFNWIWWSNVWIKWFCKL